MILPALCQEQSEEGMPLSSLDVRRCLLQYLDATASFRGSDALFALFSGVSRGRGGGIERLSKHLLDRLG